MRKHNIENKFTKSEILKTKFDKKNWKIKSRKIEEKKIGNIISSKIWIWICEEKKKNVQDGYKP